MCLGYGGDSRFAGIPKGGRGRISVGLPTLFRIFLLLRYYFFDHFKNFCVDFLNLTENEDVIGTHIH